MVTMGMMKSNWTDPRARCSYIPQFPDKLEVTICTKLARRIAMLRWLFQVMPAIDWTG